MHLLRLNGCFAGLIGSFWALFFVVPCLPPSPVEAQLSDDLIAYYTFDDGAGEVLTEATGNGTDGDLFNFDFDDQSNWTDGQIGGALRFDGVDDYVIAPEYQLAEDALTVALWVNADSAPVWASMVKNWGSSQVGQFHFGLGAGASDTLNIFITDGDGQAFNAGQDLDSLPLEEWQHVAFVADPDEGLVTQYRNGVIVSESDYIGMFTDTPNSEALGIGVKTSNEGDVADGGVPAYWDGMLDDLGIWLRSLSADEITEIYQGGLAGTSIGGISAGATPLQAGDANQDLSFDQLDIIQVSQGAKYLTGQPATWGEGDWDSAPGGEVGNPPTGDGVFDQIDVIAALGNGLYLAGPYGAIRPGGVLADERTSIMYNPANGELAVNAPAATNLTSINIESAASVFTGDAAMNLGGSFDNDSDSNIFKATFGSSFGSVSFGNVAQAGLSQEFVLGDLSVVGSLVGGGDLGNVDLVYVPEPTSVLLLSVGLAIGLLHLRRVNW